MFQLFPGVPGRIRTCGLLVRNQTLYPLSYGDLVQLGCTGLILSKKIFQANCAVSVGSDRNGLPVRQEWTITHFLSSVKLGVNLAATLRCRQHLSKQAGQASPAAALFKHRSSPCGEKGQ